MWLYFFLDRQLVEMSFCHPGDDILQYRKSDSGSEIGSWESRKVVICVFKTAQPKFSSLKIIRFSQNFTLDAKKLHNQTKECIQDTLTQSILWISE